jgi:uncharacterized protein (DUF1800 family)
MRIDPKTAWSRWTPDDQNPWDTSRAAHLMRRSGFAATPGELGKVVSDGYEKSVERLFAFEGRSRFEESMAETERVLSNTQEPQALASWWLLRMMQTPCPFLEKTTLFWHGHFATGAEKVADARAMLRQNRLLREHATGKFEPMVQGISRDVAMLIYLDSTENRKTRPNENYARELMELFCLGPGNYSEQDIKELARCFTGWEVRRNEFRFNAHQHDTGVKSFLGHRGNFGGEEGTSLVVAHKSTPLFLTRKLVNYFVTDEPLADSFLEPLAATYRESGLDTGALLKTLFTSRYFWSTDSIGHKIRSPVELAAGLVRMLELNTNMNELRDRLAALGHLPMFPPNVKGWEGGRQWINATTLIGRVNLVRQLVSSQPAAYKAGSLARAVGAGNRSGDTDWLDATLKSLLPLPLTSETSSMLYRVAQDPNLSPDARVANTLTTLAGIPEFHLN